MKSPAKLTRRTLLKASAGTLLATAAWPRGLRADDAPPKPLRLAVLNDLHIFDDKCPAYFEPLITKLNAADLDLVLIAGDLTQDSTAAQFDLFKKIFAQLKPPYRVVPGNHDMIKGHQAWDEAFPDSNNYTFTLGGIQFLALDTCQKSDYQNITVPASTLDYAQAALTKLDPKAPLVVFTHFPLGENVTYRPTNAQALLDLFKHHNLRAVFSGHFHGFTERTAGDVVLTTNRCCSLHTANHDGTKEKGYFLVIAEGAKLSRSFIEYQP